MSEYSPVKPLTQSDEQVLALVRRYYVVNKLAEPFNTEALFSIVSNIMVRAISASDTSIKYDLLAKDKAVLTTTFEPPTPLLRHIACQMMDTPQDEYHTYAHEETMKIIRDLEAYPWDAKVVITLAAFALEYGNILHLFMVPKEDNLGNALAVLHHVPKDQAFQRSRMPEITDYITVVRIVFEAVEKIVSLESKFMKLGYTYEEEEMPTLTKGLHESPVFAYWTILSIVICASYINILLGYKISKYELSSIGNKINAVRMKLKDDYLPKIDQEIEEVEDYWRRYRVIFQNPTDIVQVLTALLIPKEMKQPLVYYGTTGTSFSIEVFRHKHVLLFISGLSSIEDEIRLLKKVNDDLKKDPKVVKDLRKEDFKILWVPYVEEGEGDPTLIRKQFEYLREQMEWFVADYAIIPRVCKKLIRRLKFQGIPIVPVFNPQGRRTNDDAMLVLFSWGSSAFPWSNAEALRVNEKYNWFWTEMKSANPEIGNWIKKENYIFIYGPPEADLHDTRWLESFPIELGKVKNDPLTKKEDVIINNYHYGMVETFWGKIEALFDSMKKTTTKDPTFDEVKEFLTLRHEHSGWFVLAKGGNVRLQGRADIAVQTLKNFPSWKQDIAIDPGFDVSFERHYFNEFMKLPRHDRCLHLNLKTYVSDVYDPIHCPRCRQPMQIELVRYMCCHDKAEASGEVPIQY